LESREPELRPKTIKSYRWLLSGHLLPHLASMHLDQIGPEDVDRYKATKLREGALGPNQINKSLGLLAMILDAAGDYGHIDAARNPARGRRRRVKRSTPNRPTIEPEQLPSLLEASRKLRPMVATMAGAGLRNGETCGLDWTDFDPAAARSTLANRRPRRASARSICPTPCARNSPPTSSARCAAARVRCSATARDSGRASATLSGV